MAAETGKWSFVTVGDHTVAPDEELLTRYLLLAALQGRNWQEVRSLLAVNSGPAFTRPAWVLLIRPYSPEMERRAEEIWNRLDVGRDFRNRHLDYLVLPSQESVRKVAEVFPAARVVFRTSSWQIVALS